MAFLENPLFVLFPALILALADPGACYEYFFLIGIFILLQKNTYGQKGFQPSCTGSKVPFGNFSIFQKVSAILGFGIGCTPK